MGFTEILYMYTGIRIDGKLLWRSFRSIIYNELKGGNRSPSYISLNLFRIIWNYEDLNNESKKEDQKPWSNQFNLIVKTFFRAQR